MRSRGLVVALAVLLAVLAGAAVILYTNGVKQAAETGGDLKPVIVATQDIPAGTALDPLIEQGAFKELNIPVEAVVQGAVTSLSELRGQTTTAPIVANEQLSTSSLSSGEQVQGGAIGISKDHVAVTIKLNAPQGGDGHIQIGDNVTVYATFTGVSIIKGTLDQITNPSGTGTTDRQDLPDFTATLIPTVKVLDVINPGLDENGNQTGDTVTITLDLTKKDAQNLVFAQQQGQVWLGLLPPGESGQQLPAATVPVQLLLGKKAAA